MATRLEEIESRIDPITCYRSPGGKLAKWGLCGTFLSTLNDGQQPNICAQCQHGFQNSYWLAGIVSRLRAKAPVSVK